ncbi:zinc ion binding [Friedmanniomyces endolithicus]|uniref:Zinc ion binding n=1 Tax=Friedmanniomyces endolithicus TaxID=329885 RepID=A0AAN6L2J4_9PEZI|nr:zinc ion binding [Friedmanniomyces endolithicus]KAK0299955.1 zinc ion binding [Friedmanniomyces endolithicus]KAK0318042.1 zinc ion binding [Friedmanniomyces endolithicus]KAK0836117.1 zinc ion binding [Friedmanniomyces endolithicus]KAK0922963.1 zinc ion binding [Friedmanniomyces endolithicus]
MRAWTRRRRGAARAALELSIIAKPANPEPASSDVLIRVSHVALQFSSEGLFKLLPVLPFTYPPVPELEFSGTIVAAGDAAAADVRDTGTRVIAFVSIPDMILGRGALAEYVRVPSGNATRLAEDADMVAMAGVLGSGSTALKMLRVGGVRAGSRVLVNGASGSVGSLLVQLCKRRGVHVVAVASGGNEELVRGLGADEFIDYRMSNPLPDYLGPNYGNEPFDFVLDCVGLQALYTHSPSYLKPHGAVINVGSMEGVAATLWNWTTNTWCPIWLGGIPRQYIMFPTPPTKDDALMLVKMVEEGELKVAVDSVFEMEDAVQAYERVATKRARGRAVIRVERN